MALAAGQSLSFYEILGPLGAGGMGEVYRARDTRLEREVAIKVLPEELADDEERMRRFQREAKMLASLNHPNVAGIYGVGQHDDTYFLALELVPGENLAERLRRGPLPVDEAIDVCRQVAEGLEAAHEAGVIHRDLKPANVVITPDGKVKVLDFGLAKPIADGQSSTVDSVLTTDGRLLGTPTYMAPEQARGRPIDKRVDVWAFGCMLYECLTGRRAFDGAGLGDVLVAVLEREPDWSQLPGGVPPHVRALLERCLDKESRERLRDVGEARVVLSRGDAPKAPAERRTGVPPAAVVLVSIAAAAGAWFIANQRAAPPRPLHRLDSAKIRTLIDWPSSEVDADISPSGDSIAFGSDRDGTIDLWVAQIDAGEPQNLSQGEYPITNDGIRNLGFDSDASHAWLLELDPVVQLMAAPRSGGNFESLLEPGAASADWTRDGSRVTYHVAEEGDPIHVRAVNGPAGDPILAGRPGLHQHFPTWSFDEEWILVVRGEPATGDMQLWRVRPEGGEPEQLTFQHENMLVSFPTPIDEDTVLYVAQDSGGAGPWLWALDLPSRSIRRVMISTQRYTSVAASADGRRVVATVADPRAVLWRVPIQAEPAREEDASLLPGVPSVRARAPRIAAETGQLFYLSSRGGADGLWTLRDGRARPIWSGIEEALMFLPSISPDGRRAAVVRRRGSRVLLSIISVDSGQTLELFDGPVDVRGGSSWSPDGEWIVIGGQEPDADGEDQPGLYRFPAAGGSPERLLAEEANDPVWSPTEDLIVYCGPQLGPMLTLYGVRLDGTSVELSSEELLVRIEKSTVRFVPDGRSLVYMEQVGATIEFRLLDLETGRTRPLTELDERGEIQTFDVTPDGRIVFDRVRESSDVVLIELDGHSTSR